MSEMGEPCFALKVGNCSCELYPVWCCCCPRQELVVCDAASDRDSCGATEAAQSPMLRVRSKEPSSPSRMAVHQQLRCCDHKAPRLLQRMIGRLADFEVPCLQQHRIEVLCASAMLVVAGVVLSMASLVGGLSRGALLEHLSWITLENQEEQRFLGMRFVCIAEGPLLSPAFNPDWSGIDRCIPLSALACAGPDPVACEGRAWDPNCHGHELRATNWEKAQCSTCRNAGIALLAPILISTATYLKVMHGVGIRLSGKDSAINKVSVFFAGVLGSIANLSLMATYFLTCIRTLQRAEIFLQPMMGPGFACVLLATIFKLSASLLQLGLALEVAVNDDDSSEP